LVLISRLGRRFGLTFHFSPFGGTNLRFGFADIFASSSSSHSTQYAICGKSRNNSDVVVNARSMDAMQ
jgi:hypothetical protein